MVNKEKVTEKLILHPCQRRRTIGRTYAKMPLKLLLKLFPCMWKWVEAAVLKLGNPQMNYTPLENYSLYEVIFPWIQVVLRSNDIHSLIIRLFLTLLKSLARSMIQLLMIFYVNTELWKSDRIKSKINKNIHSPGASNRAICCEM